MQQAQSVVQNGNREILEKLVNIEKRLCKLDSIYGRIADMSHKLSKMNSKTDTLEQKISETDKKIADIEQSQSFESKHFDEMNSKQVEIENEIKKG